ncbi:hypothetical protein [Ottowia beijingensis]|uniref:hypothetical protein n=1 Tax=Ottowia beijingensis TaxID=1207057 RepID=UPI00214DE465|nr:hypothetical protein [Ottowia beijingensis]
MTLANTLGRIALSQRDLARESGQSLAAINAIVSRGEWPKRRTAAVRASVVDALRNAGATTAELRDVSLATGDDAKEKAPSAPTPEACVSAPVEVNQNPTEKEEPMLLQNTPITPQALKHFKLPRSPSWMTCKAATTCTRARRCATPAPRCWTWRRTTASSRWWPSRAPARPRWPKSWSSG